MKPEKTNGFRAKILLVDDELIVLKALSRELIAENYSVTAVSSGKEAIIALQDTSYDLVITDMTMEGINGLDVVKATRKIAPLTQIIIITGHSDEKATAEVMNIGVEDLLIKPFEIEELLFSIRLCLNRRNQ